MDGKCPIMGLQQYVNTKMEKKKAINSWNVLRNTYPSIIVTTKTYYTFYDPKSWGNAANRAIKRMSSVNYDINMRNGT